MRKVRGMGKLNGSSIICLAASAAILFLAAPAAAGDKGDDKHDSKQHDADTEHKQHAEADIVLINDGRGTTRMDMSQPQHPHNTLTATIMAAAYPGFKFVRWNVYGQRDSVTLDSATKPITKVTVKSVEVTIMAIFEDVTSGGTGGAVGYPNTTGPGDNMIVDGSVTVAVTNTDKTLETMTVNGRVKCDGLKIENWLFTQKAPPDYVFGKSYNLIDLEKVEKYIKENGHLPEVPSAAEMQKQGLDITEFNMMLLKKIEEITLYTIEMKKELEALKGRK